LELLYALHTTLLLLLKTCLLTCKIDVCVVCGVKVTFRWMVTRLAPTGRRFTAGSGCGIHTFEGRRSTLTMSSAKGRIGAPPGNQYAVGNKGGGMTSGCTEEVIKQARFLAEMGATVYELAKFFGVVEETIHFWQNTKPEFAQAIKLGRDASDERVVRSMYAKALGFEKTIEEEVVGKDGEVKTVKKKIYVPPSDTAAIFWLKNRRKNEWRDRHEYEVGRVGEFEKMSDQELEAFVNGAPLLEDRSGNE